MLVVNGTTCTRLSSRFETSLLTTIAGLVLRISPPIDGSKATHQTSPRCGGLSGLIGNVAGQVFDPLLGFPLVLLVFCHRPVAGGTITLQHVRAGKIVQKAADAAASDDAVEAGINLVVDRDR